jgi:hypothetical protein
MYKCIIVQLQFILSIYKFPSSHYTLSVLENDKRILIYCTGILCYRNLVGRRT